MFDSFILIHYDCVRGMVTSFIRYLFKYIWFFVFQIRMKTKNKLQIWISMFSYFENRKTTYFDVFCLNFSIQTKIKPLFLISYFNLSRKKKQKNPKRYGTLGTRIAFPYFDNSHKFFSALLTFYSKFAGYFSNHDFHVILHVI